jgi:dipeptidyl aminopeptidase/acylaminoacyl peptidase
MRPTALVLAFLLATPLAFAADAPPVQREEIGSRVSENVPAIPAELLERLNQYQNTRGASFAGWLGDGSMLVTTRFAETSQAHRVRMPMGMREQLTFYPEPVSSVDARPVQAGNGFVFGKDTGGNEFFQLYHYDLDNRQVRLLTNGQRSRNQGPLWSDDGRQLAWGSTERNGTDTDLWVADMATGERRMVLGEGGTWGATDFSPDGRKLLVMRFVSINESYPGELDLATGELTMFPIDGGKAAFGDFLFAPDGLGAYFVSDEESEFRTLRFHDLRDNRVTVLSRDIPWDVDSVTLADDGKHLAFVANEDGISRVHVLSIPDHREIALPEIPVGLVGRLGFSPDGRQLALTLNSATSPSDVYSIDLAERRLTRWTQSEVGGLDASRFVAPTLVRFRSFDGREIPAFYYRPAGAAPAGGFPVVINIHGGPEAQALPSFSPTIQFMVNELGLAVLVPNVRGSSGYGKTYLQLDNGMNRLDSVRDIGALLDWIGTRDELDAERVGVSGGSYGGYMVLATLVEYPERIRAGIDVVGISHFATFLNNTESYRRDLRRAEYGDERVPEMRAFMDRIAPLNNAGRIRSPLFVAQGFNDPRVPYTEAEQMVAAARGNGTPVWFLMFKDEGHGFAKKTNADYFGAASMLFWQQHLLGE